MFEPSQLQALDYDMLKEYYDILEFMLKVIREINKVIEETEV